MGLLEWMAICISYIGFRRAIKAQGVDRTTFAYHNRLALFGAWFDTFAFASECLCVLAAFRS